VTVSIADLLDLLNSPLHGPLKIYPVSNLVNSSKTDDPRCIEPAQIDWDLGHGNRRRTFIMRPIINLPLEVLTT
jgi:hypothetical protein